jgi:hypothetical protein
VPKGNGRHDDEKARRCHFAVKGARFVGFSHTTAGSSLGKLDRGSKGDRIWDLGTWVQEKMPQFKQEVCARLNQKWGVGAPRMTASFRLQVKGGPD